MIKNKSPHLANRLIQAYSQLGEKQTKTLCVYTAQIKGYFFMKQNDIPPEAVGHEDVYKTFLRGKLVYRPIEGNDEGLIEPTILRLPTPLDGEFGVSGHSYGYAGDYVSIYTGYRKKQIPENTNKLEVWLAPRFLVEHDLGNPPRNFGKILEEWDKEIPFGIFFTHGGYDNLEKYSYNVQEKHTELNYKNLYQIYQEALPFHSPQGLTPSRQSPEYKVSELAWTHLAKFKFIFSTLIPSACRYSVADLDGSGCGYT